MRKAQGALEYLIIIAAVLAIAAIVVLFITGAYKGASGGGDMSKCRLAAADCANSVATGVYATAGYVYFPSFSEACEASCILACADVSGNDLINSAYPTEGYCMPWGKGLVGPGRATACFQCAMGNTTAIIK